MFLRKSPELFHWNVRRSNIEERCKVNTSLVLFVQIVDCSRDEILRSYPHRYLDLKSKSRLWLGWICCYICLKRLLFWGKFLIFFDNTMSWNNKEYTRNGNVDLPHVNNISRKYFYHKKKIKLGYLFGIFISTILIFLLLVVFSFFIPTELLN